MHAFENLVNKRVFYRRVHGDTCFSREFDPITTPENYNVLCAGGLFVRRVPLQIIL